MSEKADETVLKLLNTLEMSLDSPIECNGSWKPYISPIVAECSRCSRDCQPRLPWLPVAPLHEEDGLHPRLEAEILRADRGQVVLLR